MFAATPWEMGALQAAFPLGSEERVSGVPAYVCQAGQREYWLARTGVGPDNATRAAARVLAHQPFSLAVSTGFACALVPTEIGTLLVGRDVTFVCAQSLEQSCAIDVPEIERDTVVEQATDAGLPCHVGRFVTSDRIIGNSSEKDRLARSTRAIGLDMESAALAAEAQRAQVPFMIVRAVSDLLDEDLPLDFNLFLRPTGWLRGIAAVLSAPSSLLGLGRLRRQSQVAAGTLTVFFQHYAVAVDDSLGGERHFTRR